MRISPKLIRQAKSINKYLPLLLRPNKTIESAQTELNWIQKELPKSQWKSAIFRRSQYEPLQYILGTQPFGSLDIICKPGVLIPRWETEEWVINLAESIVQRNPSSIKILDICTGTGCIGILLNKILDSKGISNSIDAIDISPMAIELAKLNADNCNAQVNFIQQDIFKYSNIGVYDLIVSNPPYIPMDNISSVEKSVQLYEPKLALIGDLEFYDKLVEVVKQSNASSFIFELGYSKQVDRVKGLLKDWEIDSLNDSRGNLRCVRGTTLPPWKKLV